MPDTRKKTVTHFFDEEYTQQAQYVNFSKIANLVSGSKVTAQKVLSTLMTENINSWQKVEVVSALTALKTLYLGGSGNIDGVTTNLGSGYVGSQNIRLIEAKGDFGGRLDNTAAASRYIFTKKGQMFEKYFNKEDLNVLPRYNFEGSLIEYAYFTYTVPMILVNGSNGLGSGFKCKMMPRNIKEIEKYLKLNLEGKNKTNKPFEGKPFYEGFKGTVEAGETHNKWIIKGAFTRKNKTTLDVIEVPVNETYVSYTKKLKALRDDGIIKSFIDLCDPKADTFLFTIKHDLAFSKKTDEQIEKILGLVFKDDELYVLNDENNAITVFENVNEIFWHYYRVKMEYLELRKDFLIQKLTEDIRLDASKYTFIKMIVEDELKINKRKKEAIIKDIDKVDKIIPRDNSYDYLLSMAISSLTEERMKKLMQDIKAKKAQLDLTKEISLENMWLQDLK